MRYSLNLEAIILTRHLIQQCRRPFASDSSRAVHENLLALQLLLCFLGVQPRRKLAGVSHPRVHELRTSRWRSDVPHRRLVGISHVDDDGVRVL